MNFQIFKAFKFYDTEFVFKLLIFGYYVIFESFPLARIIRFRKTSVLLNEDQAFKKKHLQSLTSVQNYIYLDLGENHSKGVYQIQTYV